MPAATGRRFVRWKAPDAAPAAPGEVAHGAQHEVVVGRAGRAGGRAAHRQAEASPGVSDRRSALPAKATRLSSA